jgi:hypothetical protein
MSIKHVLNLEVKNITKSSLATEVIIFVTYTERVFVYLIKCFKEKNKNKTLGTKVGFTVYLVVGVVGSNVI